MAQHASGEGGSDCAPSDSRVPQVSLPVARSSVTLCPVSRLYCPPPATVTSPSALFVPVNRCSSPPSALSPVPLCPSLCVRDCPQGHCSFLCHHSSLNSLLHSLFTHLLSGPVPARRGPSEKVYWVPAPCSLLLLSQHRVVFVTLAPGTSLLTCPLVPILLAGILCAVPSAHQAHSVLQTFSADIPSALAFLLVF